MTDTPSGSRRRFPRVQVSFDIDVWVKHAGQARAVVGRLVMLGAGGAFLELDGAFPRGMLMHVRFELPTFGEIACQAMVRYRNGFEGPGVGVEFLGIKTVERNRIVAFVTKHHRAPAPSG